VLWWVRLRDGVGEAWARPRGRSATGDFRAFHRRAHRTHYTTRGSVRDVLLMVGRDARGEATVFLAWVEGRQKSHLSGGGTADLNANY